MFRKYVFLFSICAIASTGCTQVNTTNDMSNEPNKFVALVRYLVKNKHATNAEVIAHVGNVVKDKGITSQHGRLIYFRGDKPFVLGRHVDVQRILMFYDKGRLREVNFALSTDKCLPLGQLFKWFGTINSPPHLVDELGRTEGITQPMPWGMYDVLYIANHKIPYTAQCTIWFTLDWKQ